MNELIENKTQKLAIAWIDLKLFGNSLLNRNRKAILNGINGSVDFGTLTAMMGPSGAGKSTLLKCINGRNMSGVDRNTQIYLSEEQTIRSSFIVQDVSGHLLMGLTAIQSLIYASKLKNSSEDTKIDHKLNAQKLLSQLMISDTEGTAVENCSGGEQKRLAIALELTAIKKPNLLCIDEPTSGLDSNAAEIVIQCLKRLTRKHSMAIVTTIHQPNNDVLMLFDMLYILGKGGLCVYEGSPQEIKHHLNVSGVELKEHQVPIEIILKIASNFDNNLKRLVTQNDKIRKSMIDRCRAEGYLALEGNHYKSTEFSFTQMWFLFERTVTYSYRSQWKAMALQLLLIEGIVLFLTQLYNKHIGEPDGCFTLGVHSNETCGQTIQYLREEELLSQNIKYLFFGGTILSALTTVATTLIFTTELKVIFNEHKNGWYSTGAYYWAKTIVELPLIILITLLYSLIFYKNIPQIDENQRLFWFILALMAGVISGQGLGFAIGVTASNSDQLALIIMIGVYLLNLFLSGFVAPLEELPKALQWITDLSFMKHLFEMQLLIIYGFKRCPNGQLSSVLYKLNLKNDDKIWTNILILGSHIVIVRGLALFILMFKVNPNTIQLNKKDIFKNKIKTIAVKPITENLE